MAENIMESYLVKLSPSVDMAGMAKFLSATKELSGVTGNAYVGMAEKVVAFQTAAVGAFTSIAAAAVKMADSVSQSDQNYRLFALHMYMNQNAARGLKVALDALGQPLENIAWDPELRKRFDDLIAVQRGMAAGLGPDFEKNMKSLRDIRFEFTKFGVETKYLSMGLVSSIFERMGLGSGALLQRLEKLNEWIISRAPEIVDFFSERLVPIFRDVGAVLGDAWGFSKELAVSFSNLVGLFTGDKSLEGTTFDFEKLAASIQKCTHMIAGFVEYLTLASEVYVHFADAVILAASGRFKDAADELRSSIMDAADADKMMYSTTNDFGNGIARQTTEDVQGGNQQSKKGFWGSLPEWLKGFHKTNPDVQRWQSTSKAFGIDDAIRKFSSMYSEQYHVNVPEALVRSIISAESGGNPQALSPKGAVGLMQLMPGTARQEGVQNPFDPTQNIQGGVHYLAKLLSMFHGDMTRAVEAYNAGPHGGMSAETMTYTNRVMGDYFRKSSGSYMATPPPTVSHSVSTGPIHIELHGTSVKADDVGKAVVDHVRHFSEMENQRNAAQFGSPYAYAQ